MLRRSFIGTCSAVASAYVVACGLVSRAFGSELRRVEVYDLVMEGWSTLGSGRLGDNGILRADDVIKFEELSLVYVQDDHGHRFTLTQDDLAKVLLGQEVRVLTTIALGHRHEVRIKPTRRAPGAEPVECFIDEWGHPVVPL